MSFDGLDSKSDEWLSLNTDLYRYTRRGTYTDFHPQPVVNKPAAQENIEFKAKNNQTYVIDLQKMEQRNKQYNTKRPIMWNEDSGTWAFQNEHQNLVDYPDDINTRIHAQLRSHSQLCDVRPLRISEGMPYGITPKHCSENPESQF